CRLRSSLFFFQAEDGIRDRNVTGVQTCALPILDTSVPPRDTFPPVTSQNRAASLQAVDFPPPEGPMSAVTSPCLAVKLTSSSTPSPSRRVGKECSSGRAPDERKEKTMQGRTTRQ